MQKTVYVPIEYDSNDEEDETLIIPFCRTPLSRRSSAAMQPAPSWIMSNAGRPPLARRTIQPNNSHGVGP